jgi:membrane fusion protein, multidrug efflux system
MKYSIYITMAIMALMSCGGEAPVDNAAKLQTLKDQRAKLETQIADLEKLVARENPGAAQAGKTHIVTADAVKVDLFQHFIDLQGMVKAENSQPATSKMPGTLTKVFVNDGSAVSRGQLIAELDGSIMQSGKAELENQLRFATDVYDRQKGLWDQKIGTEVQFLQAKNGKEAIEKSLATMQEQLANLRIYAPIGGTVDMVILKAGQAIAPGMPLCNIINMGDLRVQGDVPESYAGKLKRGDKVVVHFPDLGRDINSTITYVSKSINPLNRTISVECALPSAEQYRANMIAVMKIVDYQNAKAISIPAGLVRQTAAGDAVMMAGTDRVARQVNVKIGQSYNGRVEILSGLSAGDQIITTGYQNVNEGDKLEF